MKPVSQLWEVNNFHCESEPPASPFLYSQCPIYQKYVCCYCVHTISVHVSHNVHRKAKIMTLILTVDHEAILQVITNYSYSNFHYLYFLFVCRSLQCVLPGLKESFFKLKSKIRESKLLQLFLCNCRTKSEVWLWANPDLPPLPPSLLLRHILYSNRWPRVTYTKELFFSLAWLDIRTSFSLEQCKAPLLQLKERLGPQSVASIIKSEYMFVQSHYYKGFKIMNISACLSCLSNHWHYDWTQ